MIEATARAYHEDVPASRSGAWRRIVAGALAVFALAARPNPASATTASFEVADQAVVQVIGRVAAITIRTWNRNTVQVDWPDGQPFEPSRSTLRTQSSFLIPTVTVQEYLSPAGPVMATLLPEDFPVPGVIPGLHDVVRVRENLAPGDDGRNSPPTQLTVTIPASTTLVNVRSGRGSITLTDYHGTTIAAIGRGSVTLRNVSGDAFVQPLNGSFYALGSDFDRLRIRSNHADEVFEGCRVTQIEATTLTGNIMFDNGMFRLGLARFDSDRGSIALGVNGGAQLGAHTQDGHVFTLFPPDASPQPMFGDGGASSDGDSLALVGNGGPLVNASSVHGNVFLYDGSLTDPRPVALTAPWRPMLKLLRNTRDASERGAVAGRRR